METSKEVIGNQGDRATEVFSGSVSNTAVEQIYKESVLYFSQIIRNKLAPRAEPYTLLDVGSFRGELLEAIEKELADEYVFESTGIDRDEGALKHNASAEHIVVGDVSKMPFENESFDLTFARYVLQWNSSEKQKQIIKEIFRTTKGFAIVQHAGAEKEEREEWQKRMHTLVLSGVEKISRPDAYFSSSSEIEGWMTEQKIPFQRLQHRIVLKVSDIFIEKYNLSEAEAQKAKDILGDKDYIEQTTWILVKE